MAGIELGQKRACVEEEAAGIPEEQVDPAQVAIPARTADEQLVVTVDGQLFLGVLQALPYLVNYPYECTEQSLNRFLSSGIVSSVFDRYPAVAEMATKLSERDTRYETWDGADPNRKMGLEETPWLQASRGGSEERRDADLWTFRCLYRGDFIDQNLDNYSVAKENDRKRKYLDGEETNAEESPGEEKSPSEKKSPGKEKSPGQKESR